MTRQDYVPNGGRQQYVKYALGTLIVAPLLVLSALVAFARVNGDKFLSIQTGSMRPSYGVGDLVIVKPIQPDTVKIGDVVTFTSQNDETQTLTHRIIATPAQTGNGTYQTQGDANELPDTPIPPENILGRVAYSVPGAGRIVDFVYSWPGLIMIVYVPALVILYGELKRLIAYYKSQQPYAVPGYKRDSVSDLAGKKALPRSVLLVATGIVIVVVATPAASAMLNTHVVLSGTTISSHAP